MAGPPPAGLDGTRGEPLPNQRRATKARTVCRSSLVVQLHAGTPVTTSRLSGTRVFEISLPRVRTTHPVTYLLGHRSPASRRLPSRRLPGATCTGRSSPKMEGSVQPAESTDRADKLPARGRARKARVLWAFQAAQMALQQWQAQPARRGPHRVICPRHPPAKAQARQLLRCDPGARPSRRGGDREAHVGLWRP